MGKHWLILISLAVVGAGIALLPFPFSSPRPAERTIRIEASQYAFTPGEIRVNSGDRVTLELVSTDVVHGLYIDAYDLSVQADPGEKASLNFTANRSGAFRIRCNVTCGAMHPFMIGRLYVGQNTLLYRTAGLTALTAFALLVVSRKSHLWRESGR